MTMFYIDQYNHTDPTNSLFVDLDERAGDFLFDLLLDPIALSMKEQGDDEWGKDYRLSWNITESQSLSDLPNEIFMQAYDIIKKSDNKDLQPFVSEILEKMQADPRFNQSKI